MLKQTCAVVCTSTSSLDEYKNKSPLIHTLRLNIHTKKGQYTDGETMSAKQFYQYLNQFPNDLPTTSPPEFNTIIELFLKLVDEGYTDVIVSTLSSSLSETAKIITDAASLMRNKINVHVVDTGSLCILEGLVSLEAARLVEAGATPFEVVRYLMTMKRNLHIFFEVDTLKFLVKNGRISAIGGMLGSIMRLKPIIHLNNGEMRVIAKVRNTDNALDYLTNQVVKELKMHSGETEMFGLYAGDKGLYQDLEMRVRHKTGRTMEAYPISPVVGAHIGERATAVGLWIK